MHFRMRGWHIRVRARRQLPSHHDRRIVNPSSSSEEDVLSFDLLRLKGSYTCARGRVLAGVWAIAFANGACAAGMRIRILAGVWEIHGGRSYHSMFARANTDSVVMDLSVDALRVNAAAHSLWALVNFKENYFGAFTHFVSSEECARARAMRVCILRMGAHWTYAYPHAQVRARGETELGVNPRDPPIPGPPAVEGVWPAVRLSRALT